MTSVNSETKLAQWAFDEVLGRPLVMPRPSERDEIRETLAVEYAGPILRIASGDHHAEEMIRDFERVAAEQARRQIKGRQP
jgi:hypothetical protein